MRVPNNSLFIFGLCHVFFLLSTGLLRSKTQPCQHRCSFRFFFWAGMMAVALGTLMMKLGVSICQGSPRMKGKALRATCLQPLQMGRSEITSFVLHNFSIFVGKKPYATFRSSTEDDDPWRFFFGCK